MQPYLEALGIVLRRLLVTQWRVREDVGGAAHAFPGRHRATRGAELTEAVEAPGGAVVAVVIARHDDHGLVPIGEIPEARQRLAREVHVRDEVGQQPLLLVGLRNGHLAQVHPVGFGVRGGVAVELVVRADGSQAVALLRGPRGVALARVHHRGGQVVGEGRGLAGSHAAQRHGRVGSGRGGAAVERGQRRGAAQGVAIGAAVELHGLVDDAVAHGVGGIHQQVAVGELGPRAGQAQQRREIGAGRHGNEVAPGIDPVRQQRDLRAAESRLCQNHHVIGGQRGGVDRGDVCYGKGTEAFVAQDLGVVQPEVAVARGQYQNGPTRALGRVGRLYGLVPAQ